MYTIFATLCCATIALATSPPRYDSTTSNPSLGPTVSILSRTPTNVQVSASSHANYALNLYQMESIYLNFTSQIGPVFTKTARKIRRRLRKIKKRSQLRQLYSIPKMLSLYAPMFRAFGRGTNLVYDWQLASKYPTTNGPFIYFTPKQWNNVLAGLQMFGTGSIQVQQYLAQLEYQVSYQLDNLMRQDAQNIIMQNDLVQQMDTSNKNLATSMQTIRSGLESILTTHSMGATRIQNNAAAGKFLIAYYKWVKDMIAVFNEMAPTTQNFGGALQAIGTLNPKSNKFVVNTKSVNTLYQTTARRMKYLCEVLANYFSRYNNVLINLI